MLESPAPAAEHSLQSLSGLLQRLPLEAEAVKQPRRTVGPWGASLHQGPSVWLTLSCQQLGVHRPAAPCLKPPLHPAHWNGSGHTCTPYPQAGRGGGRLPTQDHH